MSAAEATTPGAGPGPRPTAGVVIPMFKRRPTTPAATPPPSDGVAGEHQSASQQLAEQIETLFHHHGLTLTDEDAARAYDVTLDLVHLMHEGALADGILTAEQLRQLSTMLDGMRRAPQLL